MGKQVWKPGNMVYPLPAVLVSSVDAAGKPNAMTAAWTGTVCSEPPMAYVSIRKERYSNPVIRESGEFTINLTTEAIAHATDFCGVKSGRDMDKFQATGLTPVPGMTVKCPMVGESPVSIECQVTQILELGSHDMFIGKVTAVVVDEKYMNEKGKFDLAKAKPIAYSHGEYYTLGDLIGTFGYSVRKKK